MTYQQIVMQYHACMNTAVVKIVVHRIIPIGYSPVYEYQEDREEKSNKPS